MKADGFIRVLRIIFLMLIMVFFCPFAYGKIIYVDDDATGANDGSSWQNAYTFLQDALADTNSTERPVEIRVAQGIYKPDQGANQTAGDRDATFLLINGVTIIGGFAGFGETNPNARDIEVYETILSGDLSENDIDVNDPGNLYYLPNRGDNSYHVITGSNTDATAILDCFTITGGYISVIPLHGGLIGGAGMFISSGSPTLINCTFTDNLTANSGGGLLIYDDSNPTLINCNFTRNYAESGGGIFSSESSPILINCRFIDNLTAYRGGRMCNFGGNPILTNCTFSRNSAFRQDFGPDSVGGGMYNRNGNLVLTNCAFIENSAAFAGGGMLNEGCNTVLNMCEFVMNTALWYNGAVLIIDGQLIAKGCIFKKNYQGAVEVVDISDPIFTDCTFSGNSSSRSGGAVRVFYATFNHCIFAGNRVLGNDSTGGAVYCHNTATFNNCTFSNNWADSRYTIDCEDMTYVMNNSILWGYEDQMDVDDPYAASTSVRYSNVRGGWPGEGNIDDDPCFVDPGYWADADDPNIVVEPNDPNAVWIDGDYHLKSQAGRWNSVSESWIVDDVTSPCIDAGDPNTPVAFEPSPNGGFINMGAYGGTVEASKSPSGQDALYGGGTGEPNDPYLIYTAEQMWNTGSISHHWDKHFKLMADINLDEYRPKGCRTIGTYEKHSVSTPFTGVFDGNGKRIFNFNYSTTSLDDVGLFGYVYGSMGQVVIKDLGLVDPNIDARNGRYVGALVGLLLDGTIRDCYVQGGSISGGDCTGGLVGACVQVSMPTQREIINCYCTSTVTGNTYVGGLVGHYSGTINNCYFAGNVAGYEYVGGLLGESFYSEISKCYSTGMVLGIHQVGGLIGSIWGHDAVFRSTSSISVTGFDQVGGLVGLNIYGEIFNCYSTGSVSGISNVAGLVGVNQGIVSNCYSAGLVKGQSQTGGLIGSLDEDPFYPAGSVIDSFWDIETSGQSTSAGGTGLTTAEMQTASTFLEAGWDFVDETENGTEDIWWILEGRDYPRLAWELIE